jgi:sugar transferase EpsL
VVLARSTSNLALAGRALPPSAPRWMRLVAPRAVGLRAADRGRTIPQNCDDRDEEGWLTRRRDARSAPRMLPRDRRLKRLVDVVGAAVGLAALSPVFVVVTGAVVVLHGWPPIFKQRRPGLNGKVFTLMKFRTMSNATDEKGRLLPDEARLTRFGRWLRASSLDELPELLNVLRGEMSLVGPRPLLVQYLGRYSPEQARRHDVKPGITGWAQINGRNSIEWDEKLALDVWYVDNWSLALDFEIIFRTVGAVLSRSGITAEGSATMPEFLGSTRDLH